MGIFDFMKDVGQKLTGKGDDDQRNEALEERMKGNALMRHVSGQVLRIPPLDD